MAEFGEPMKKCPTCRRFSDDDAITCDCGYSFLTERQAASSAPVHRRGWVGVNVWAVLLGLYGDTVVRSLVSVPPLALWWVSCAVLVGAYMASEAISKRVRNTPFGLRSPVLAAFALVLAYALVATNLAYAVYRAVNLYQ
jgi:hypothetical protein